MPKINVSVMKCECGAKLCSYGKNSDIGRDSLLLVRNATLTKVKHRFFHHDGKAGVIIRVTLLCEKCNKTMTKTIKSFVKE